MSQCAEYLRKLAKKYQHSDGSPGELGTTWGWRDIAKHLRAAADEVSHPGECPGEPIPRDPMDPGYQRALFAELCDKASGNTIDRRDYMRAIALIGLLISQRDAEIAVLRDEVKKLSEIVDTQAKHIESRRETLVFQEKLRREQEAELIATTDDNRRFREALAVIREVITEFDDGDGNAPNHCHQVPGVWDWSNGPPDGGTPCERCATWNKLVNLAKSQEPPQQPRGDVAGTSPTFISD